MRKNLFIILFFGLLFSGCSANWHITKAKEKCPEYFKQDTTINNVVFKLDTIVKLDTNINVILPRDTVTIEKLIPINRNFDKVIKKQGIITTEIEAVKGLLKVNSYLDSSYIYNLKAEITLKDAKITTLTTINTQSKITIQEQQHKLKTFLKWLKWIGISLGFLIILAIVFKLYSWIKK